MGFNPLSPRVEHALKLVALSSPEDFQEDDALWGLWARQVAWAALTGDDEQLTHLENTLDAGRRQKLAREFVALGHPTEPPAPSP